MRSIRVLTAGLLVAAFSLPALAGTYQNEVLVLASAATRVDPGTMRARKGLEIQNLGPNPIYCAPGVSADAVSTKARKISTGESWGISLFYGIAVYCIAASADQVTGAATIVTEVP